MIDWRDSDGRPERSISAAAVIRWGGAALLVLAAHGAGAWAALHWQPIEAMPSQPPPAVMIELAPLAVAPPTPQQELAPGPQMTESQPEPTPDRPTPVEDAPPDPTPPDPQQVVQEDRPDPQRSPSPEIEPLDLPKKHTAEAVVAPPPKQPAEKRPPPRANEAERKKPVDRDKPRQRQTTAPTAQARTADSTAAPSSGAAFSPSVSPATWRGELMAHLNRHKRRPAGAGAGTASVAFTISRSGQVLSARLIGSSGDPVLDQEAAALPRRASPVPAPPPGVGGASITLTVPIHFGS